MEKIIVLGTGWAMSEKLFNTSFVLENNKKEKLLVDTGGGNGILSQLENAKIDLGDIHHLFITHKHTDHILGVLWIIRKLEFNYIRKGKYQGTLTIYCHSELEEIIRELCKLTLKQRFIDLLDSIIIFKTVKDKEIVNINGYDVKVLDIHGKTTLQYGFKAILNNGKTFIFLGDENMNPLLNSRAARADYIMHEAFCLDSEETKFHAYEKNHSTALSAARKLSELEVKNIILYHTEETHGNKRKELYTKEAREVFKRNIIVPNDLEVIEIVRKLTK